MNEELDWTKFSRTVVIDARLEKVMDSWMSQAQLEKFFLKEAKFYKNGVQKEAEERIELGDSYEFSWYGTDFTSTGEVLANDHSNHLRFSFLTCVVDVECVEEHGYAVLNLTQSKIPTDDESKLRYYVECTRGWTFYLTNLKSILEGGLDLRNKDDRFQRVINT